MHALQISSPKGHAFDTLEVLAKNRKMQWLQLALTV